MRVTADRTVCMGAGNCSYAAPGVFDQDDDEGLVIVLAADVPADAEQSVQYAQRSCPSGAIAITRDQAS